MADYYLAPSLVRLRASINAEYPNRDTASDGWIGDASHSARKSDHNPDWDAGGVVRAIDVDIDGRRPGRNLRAELLDATIGHRAVWYVISNRVIYSRTYAWAARPYTGSNPHDKHVHVSIRHTDAAENDTTLRLIPPRPEDTDMPLTDADVYKILNTPLGMKDKAGQPVTVGSALRAGAWLAVENMEGGAIDEQLDRVEEQTRE